jgi:predicted ABC-type transport system involved in lysophospholipase L1 biosynthesis ATPase subunit
MHAVTSAESSATQGRTSRGKTTLLMYETLCKTIRGAELKFSAKRLNAINPENRIRAKDIGWFISADHLAWNT